MINNIFEFTLPFLFFLVVGKPNVTSYQDDAKPYSIFVECSFTKPSIIALDFTFKGAVVFWGCYLAWKTKYVIIES